MSKSPDDALLVPEEKPVFDAETRQAAIAICRRSAAIPVGVAVNTYACHMVELGYPHVKNTSEEQPLLGNHALTLAELAWQEALDGRPWTRDVDRAAARMLEGGWTPDPSVMAVLDSEVRDV